MMRIGHGFDVHKFGGVGPCMLGGVPVPYEQGLLAHSDGDVVLHAVSDALLGAIGAGDIGRHFPDTAAEFKGIDSRILLRDVFARVQQAGYAIGNLDVTIIAQAPKMAPSHAMALAIRASRSPWVRQGRAASCTSTHFPSTTCRALSTE